MIDMAHQTRLKSRWKLLILHMAVVDVVAICILISLIVDKARNGSGISFAVVIIVLVLLLMINLAFYFIARSIKYIIKNEFGED